MKVLFYLLFISTLFADANSIGHGLRFNGDGYVRIEDSESLTLDGDFTIEFWAKIDTTLIYSHILNKHQPGINNDSSWVVKAYHHYDNPNEKPSLFFGWPYAGNEEKIEISEQYKSNKWYHYAICYDNREESISFWINGSKIKSVNRSIALSDTDWPLYIGSEVKYNFFKGILSEIRISNIVRYVSGFKSPPAYDVDSYTIAYWPCNEKQGSVLHDLSKNGNHGEIINAEFISKKERSFIPIIILIALIIAGMLFLNRKRTNVPISSAAVNDQRDDTTPKNTIQLFGEFRVWDRTGTDITSKFTPIIKELFLMILIFSHRNGNGITTEKITTAFWPDSDAEHAKNARSTTTARLRKILAKLDSISLDYSNKKWLINSGRQIDCDYISFSNWKENNKPMDSHLLDILTKGAFLSDVSIEWLDGIQAEIEIAAIDCLISVLGSSSSLNPMEKLSLTDSILRWDSFNDFAMKEKVETLKAMGKVGLAKKFEDKFNAVT